MARGFGVAAALAVLLLAAAAAGFAVAPEQVAPDPDQALSRAARWSPVSGLAVQLEVGLPPGFAAAAGANTAAEVELVRDAVRAALLAWESPVLRFDVHFDAPGAVEGPFQGFDIDVFAVPCTHPFFGCTGSFFGATDTAEVWSSARRLTNGEYRAGWSFTGADVVLNADALAAFSVIFGLTPQEEIDGFQRLLMHELGHAIGLGHPNSNNPFGLSTNYDDDFDPLNELQIPWLDPFGGLLFSPFRDDMAVMSNRPCGDPLIAPCNALFSTAVRPDDAGGRDALYPPPSACSDGVDNDGDGRIDFDGGARFHGQAVGLPDQDCAGTPMRDRERPGYACGLGFELALLLPPLLRLRGRRRCMPTSARMAPATTA